MIIHGIVFVVPVFRYYNINLFTVMVKVSVFMIKFQLFDIDWLFHLTHKYHMDTTAWVIYKGLVAALVQQPYCFAYWKLQQSWLLTGKLWYSLEQAILILQLVNYCNIALSIETLPLLHPLGNFSWVHQSQYKHQELIRCLY